MKYLCIIIMIAAWPLIASAQQDPTAPRAAIGLQLSQVQQDFGMGLNLTSPYVAHGHVAARLKGNFSFHEHFHEGEVTWTPYSNASIGVVGVTGQIGNFLRLYSEGGLVILFPNEKFSSENAVAGGYGLFGFEMLIDKRNSYFLEVGGAGTGARANELPGNPIYSNGMVISVGYRLQL